MESVIDQYINDRNSNLYIYTRRQYLCNNGDDECNRGCPSHTDIYADRPALSELNSATTSSSISQWYCRNMESIIDQYIINRNSNLYIYTRQQYLCNNGDAECNRKCPDHTDIYTDRPALSELN